MLRNNGLLVALFVSLGVLAQDAPIKFGDVSQEILTQRTYSADTSAVAVVLCDYGESNIIFAEAVGDFQIQFERTKRIKILTKDGLQWADLTIPLYSSVSGNEKLISLKGITFNLENGKVVESKLTPESIFKEKYDENLDFVKATFPNVREGSVIEINYKLKSDFLGNLADWEFQSTIPVEWSEYRASVPEFFRYEKYMQGYLPLTITDETAEQVSINTSASDRGVYGGSTFYNQRITFRSLKTRWVMQGVPAFRSEPYITTYKDFISKINFELETIQFPGQMVKVMTGSWADINKSYAESGAFGGEVKGNAFLKKIVNEVVIAGTQTEVKVAALYNYVKENVAWDGATRKFTQKPLRQVLEQKRGNSAEINLLLASLLDKAAIDARPVLISTRDHGFLREYTPAASQFNYVACLASWDGKQILLDATDAFLPAGYLPSRCLNGKGLVVSPDGHEWIDLVAPAKSRTVVTSELALNIEGQLTGKMNFEHHGHQGHNKRKEYFKKGEEEYIKEFIRNRPWIINTKEFENKADLHLGFKEKYELVINEHAAVTGDHVYLSPFVSHQRTENPFKPEQREYPVDFGGAFDEVYMMKLRIPPGYQVDELPTTKVFVLPGNAARYTLSASANADQITFTSTLSVNRSIFSPDEYVNLREFYNHVVSKQSEQIVVKKK